MPGAEDIPVVGQGSVLPDVENDGAGNGRVSGGLSPPAPSSVAPIGIPARPPDVPEPIIVGVDADDAGPAKEPPADVPHVPDAVPVLPPPSNSDVDMDDEPGMPVVDIPVPKDVPDIELDTPDVVPGIEVPVLTPIEGLPKDACGSAPPMPAHTVGVPIVGDVPDIIGATPGVASSVEPSGMPVGATGEPGPMPSGEVMPMLETGVGMVCACATTQLKTIAAAVKLNRRMDIMCIAPSTKLHLRCVSGTDEADYAGTARRCRVQRLTSAASSYSPC